MPKKKDKTAGLAWQAEAFKFFFFRTNDSMLGSQFVAYRDWYSGIPSRRVLETHASIIYSRITDICRRKDKIRFHRLFSAFPLFSDIYRLRAAQSGVQAVDSLWGGRDLKIYLRVATIKLSWPSRPGRDGRGARGRSGCRLLSGRRETASLYQNIHPEYSIKGRKE